MTILYKLTDHNAQTQGATQWGPGVTHTAREGKPRLCSDTVLHAYTHPMLALLLNPRHADIRAPRLWEAEGDVVVREHQLKAGCKTLTTLRELVVPEVTTEQRVEFAIRCALAVCKAPAFVAWADAWLSGADRSNTAAYAAYAAYAADAADAAYAAYAAAAYAADAAAYADAAAAYADAAAYAADAADACAACAAYAADAADLEAVANQVFGRVTLIAKGE